MTMTTISRAASKGKCETYVIINKLWEIPQDITPTETIAELGLVKLHVLAETTSSITIQRNRIARRSKREKVKAAKVICGQCAVREACLKDALANNENYGIRGGFTPSERQNLISSRRRIAKRR